MFSSGLLISKKEQYTVIYCCFRHWIWAGFGAWNIFQQGKEGKMFPAKGSQQDNDSQREEFKKSHFHGYGNESQGRDRQGYLGKLKKLSASFVSFWFFLLCGL